MLLLGANARRTRAPLGPARLVEVLYAALPPISCSDSAVLLGNAGATFFRRRRRRRQFRKLGWRRWWRCSRRFFGRLRFFRGRPQFRRIGFPQFGRAQLKLDVVAFRSAWIPVAWLALHPRNKSRRERKNRAARKAQLLLLLAASVQEARAQTRAKDPGRRRPAAADLFPRPVPGLPSRTSL